MALPFMAKNKYTFSSFYAAWLKWNKMLKLHINDLVFFL